MGAEIEPGREPLTALMLGAGLQSTAMVVLACQGKLGITPDVALFANVGDDSEEPATLRYVREVLGPWAAERGLPVHELHKTRRDGAAETILGRMCREGSRSTVIPVRLSGGKPGGRSCTADFKIGVTGRWLKAHGATADNPATVALGISVDEIERANPSRGNAYERLVFPLLQLGIRRSDCPAIIREAGLPIPGKSACWFCPNRRLEQWAALRANDPDTFDRVADLEEMLSARTAAAGQGPVFMSNVPQPLREVIPEGVQTLDLWPTNDGGGTDFGGGCDNGWCGL